MDFAVAQATFLLYPISNLTVHHMRLAIGSRMGLCFRVIRGPEFFQDNMNVSAPKTETADRCSSQSSRGPRNYLRRNLVQSAFVFGLVGRDHTLRFQSVSGISSFGFSKFMLGGISPVSSTRVALMMLASPLAASK